MARGFALFVFACALWSPSCGETTVDLFRRNADGPPLSVTYLMEGGGADELQSLFLTVRDVRLLREEDVADGLDGVGSLPEPVAVELLGLEGRARLLTTRYYGDGVFTHVRLDLGAEPVGAVGHDGQEIIWTPAGTSSQLVELPSPFVVDRDGSLNHSLVLHMSPDESIVRVEDVSGGVVHRFQPVVRARVLTGTETVPADDYWGGLVAASEDYRRLEVASDVERTSGDRAAVASVLVTSATLLLQPNGVPVTSLPGLSSIPELLDARFWVRGDYARSAHSYLPELRAGSVLLDSLMPANGSDAAVVTEVRVVGVEPDGVFVVRLLEVERGVEEVGGALELIDDPLEWRVRLGPSAAVINASGFLSSRADVRVGMRVKLHFPSFVTEPFEALRAVSQGRAEHHGHIAERQSLDSVASLRLGPRAAAIASGLVATEETLVEVEANSLFATVDVQGAPLVLVRALLPGVRTVVRGRITGPADNPKIESGAITVRPGRFRGFVSAASESSGTFDATVDSIDAPFGGETSSPPFTVRISSSAVFEGDALTRAEFFALFDSLSVGERLSVTVAGLASGEPNEVDAYQIRVRAE